MYDQNGNAIADINIDGQKVEVILSPNDKLAKESVEEVVVSKKGIQQVKNLLINSPDWVKSNTELLEKLADKSDEFIKKVDEYYSSAIPKSTPKNFNGEGIYDGIKFNKYGHPELFEYVSDSKHIVDIEMGNVPKLVILQFHQNNKMIINKNKINTPTNINHTLPHFYYFCKKLKP